MAMRVLLQSTQYFVVCRSKAIVERTQHDITGPWKARERAARALRFATSLAEYTHLCRNHLEMEFHSLVLRIITTAY
jgi:hypothetical protein